MLNIPLLILIQQSSLFLSECLVFLKQNNYPPNKIMQNIKLKSEYIHEWRLHSQKKKNALL